MDKEGFKQIISPVLDQMGIDLVDVDLYGKGGRTILRIYIDEEGGITLQRCAEASRSIADILDRKDPIPSRYILEVSSPGLYRPLKREKDFQRNIGKPINVRLKEEDEEKEIQGKIVEISENTLVLETAAGKNHISLDKILLAKLVIKI